MENREADRIPGRRRRGFGLYIFSGLLLLLAVIAAVLFFLSPDSITRISHPFGGKSIEQQAKSDDNRNGSKGPDASGSSTDMTLSDKQMSDAAIATAQRSGTAEGDPAGNTAAGASGKNGNGQKAANGSDSGDTSSCQDLADTIEDFFNTLDTRDYIREFELNSPSVIYFPELIQKLIDNPPVVSGETDDLFTILQNTAHFFRIIGKNNIFILKGILDRERATFEQVLADFYQLTDQPDCLKKRFNLVMGQEPLYSYAGFFLNTMGGRLYLFRRDSMSRMVVSYYAILLIDQANREGRNSYGIEIKDAIDNLIIEIESSRIKLQMRDEYLDTLYDLKVKYQ